jgi:hypothetical protein
MCISAISRYSAKREHQKLVRSDSRCALKETHQKMTARSKRDECIKKGMQWAAIIPNSKVGGQALPS